MKFSLKQELSLIITVFFIAMIGLACRLPFTLAKEALPGTSTVSPFDAQAVEEILQNVQEETGQFAFTITEEQLTSYVTLKLAETQENFTLQNVSITLDDNVINLKTDLDMTTLGIKTPAELIFSASTNTEGELVFSLESITIGKLNLSDSVEQGISNTVEEALNSNFASQLSGFRIDTVYIDNGMITISGARR